MILDDNRSTDPEDVAVLFAAILQYGYANEERLDQSIQSIGYANLMSHATRAATAIAADHDDEGDSWDGCIWLERLSEHESGSLAERLYAENPAVETIVAEFLADIRSE